MVQLMANGHYPRMLHVSQWSRSTGYHMVAPSQKSFCVCVCVCARVCMCFGFLLLLGRPCFAVALLLLCSCLGCPCRVRRNGPRLPRLLVSGGKAARALGRRSIQTRAAVDRGEARANRAFRVAIQRFVVRALPVGTVQHVTVGGGVRDPHAVVIPGRQTRPTPSQLTATRCPRCVAWTWALDLGLTGAWQDGRWNSH